MYGTKNTTFVYPDDPSFEPWWGALVLRATETERIARKRDRLEAEAFALELKASEHDAAGRWTTGDGLRKRAEALRAESRS